MTESLISSQFSVLRQYGYAQAKGVFTQDKVENLRALLELYLKDQDTPGRRLFGESWARAREHALSARLNDLMTQAFAESGVTDLRDIKCIRATLFDKTPGTNWKVPWHQDLTIPIQAEPEDRDAIALRAFGPWTNKDTIPHVQPPVHILERMLAARIHLDPCGLDNGALRVLAGSHRHGRLDAAQIKEWRGNADALVDCVAEAGDVLLMQPLLLHASSPATNPARRRVLHLEFAACDLPSPLQWRSF